MSGIDDAIETLLDPTNHDQVAAALQQRKAVAESRDAAVYDLLLRAVELNVNPKIVIDVDPARTPHASVGTGEFSFELTTEQFDQIREADGRTIGQVKLLRELTGLSLANALIACDTLKLNDYQF